MSAAFRCGYVALVGRPNVGKSTLLNSLLGQKISITSHRPQTTRHRILGINTLEQAQIVYVDTPGLHQGNRKALNRAINRTAADTLHAVDVVAFLVEGVRWSDEDRWVLDLLKDVEVPVILVVNKVDLLEDKAALLPHMQTLAALYDFADIVPLSALKRDNLDRFEACVIEHLPEQAPLYPEDQITDRSERFLAAERVREKLFRKLGQEVPYGLTVEIEQFKQEGNLRTIHALIWVERDSHKAMVIGKGGSRLKEVGSEARRELETLFDGKVFLQLWVKVKEGWADDERALRSLGYGDDQ
ncbi:MAG TPA: GTPase Era [Gammaproteobacteria bacterium]|nr:GTPase Era [Gammaproteobacteria bacterium]